MNFLCEAPNIKISQNNKSISTIKSVLSLQENERKITLNCAEYIKEFKRGFTCDMQLESCQRNEDGEDKGLVYEDIKDLVLVYINKKFDCEKVAQYEYIFYK